MLYFVLYILGLFIVLLIAFLTCFHSLYSLIAYLMGAPYVPTNMKEVEAILNKVHLTSKSKVIELGSGDGRFINAAVKKFDCYGLGIEIQPLLLLYSNITSKLRNVSNAHFKNQNFFKTNLKEYDVIFMFLLPLTLIKLKEKLITDTKKDALIISHGFKITGFEKYLINTIEHQPYHTYFYKIKR